MATEAFSIHVVARCMTFMGVSVHTDQLLYRSPYLPTTRVIDVHYSYCDKPVSGQLVTFSTFSGAVLKCQYKKVTMHYMHKKLTMHVLYISYKCTDSS